MGRDQYPVNSEDYWRYARASVTGTSHLKTGSCCQDAGAVRAVTTAEGAWLVAGVADGAGSCRLSAQGARICCAVFGAEMERLLQERNKSFSMDRRDAEAVIGKMRLVIDEAAEQAEAVARHYDSAVCRPIGHADKERTVPSDPRRPLTRKDFASTFVGAVIGEKASAFFQIGDGGMVVRANGEEGYRPVFWPQSGQYANETYFVTDRSVRLQFEARTGGIDEIALFSDGLQRLVLTIRERTAYAPFFQDLFGQLRRKAKREGLSEPLSAGLARFLGSRRINARTDDDKTLILATRLLHETVVLHETATRT